MPDKKVALRKVPKHGYISVKGLKTCQECTYPICREGFTCPICGSRKLV